MNPIKRWLDRYRVPVHFLHIGKTGGTALKHALEPLAAQHRWLKLHWHEPTLADVPPGEKVFFFLRDPVSRFVSGFNSRQRQGKPRHDAPWEPGEPEAFERFQTPNQLGSALYSNQLESRAAAEAAMRSIRHVRDSYWRWLHSEEHLERRAPDIVFIGQQEHLESDVSALEQRIGLRIGGLPDDQVLAHRTPPALDTRLDAAARQNLARWYAREYDAIAACARLAKRGNFGGSLAERPG